MKKTIKKLAALLLAGALTAGMSAATFADVSITVNRDSTYETGASGNRDYTYYKVFDAVLSGENTSSGGGYDADGTPGAINTTKGVYASYIASSNVAAKLGSWSNGSWTRSTGNEWFDLTPIAGSTNYNVAWVGSASDADTVQEAAKWLLENEVYDSSGTLQAASDGESWTAEVPEGYYLLKGSEGQNLVAATTDIAIKEKNSYPTIDKKEKDEDKATYVDDNVHVAVGDTINYTVDVKVPADANADIVVADTMSSGLSYSNDVVAKIGEVEVTSGVAYADAADLGTATWKATITPDDNNKGKVIQFVFSAVVTSAALVDTGKQNEVTLDYNNGHYTMPDHVNHDVYYGGIIKKSETEQGEVLKGVKFKLEENGKEFKVSKPEGKDYYIPDANGSSEVITDEKGCIVIRGLDGDKKYELTETKALQGYNLLDHKVEINKHLDETTDENAKFTEGEYPAGYDMVINKKGSLLPSTGGMGTTIFYVIGGILVLAAVIVLISKRRVQQ